MSKLCSHLVCAFNACKESDELPCSLLLVLSSTKCLLLTGWYAEMLPNIISQS